MKERGQVVTGITIMVVLLAFFALYVLFSPALDAIWTTTETEAAGTNAPSSIWDNLRLVWPAIMVVVIIMLLVWLYARSGRVEAGYSTFYRAIKLTGGEIC